MKNKYHLQILSIMAISITSYTVQANDGIIQPEETMSSLSSYASKCVDALATQSKQALNSAINTMAPHMQSLATRINQNYQNLNLQLTKIIITNRINIKKARAIWIENPALMGKLIPLGFTILHDFLHETVQLTQAPKKVQKSLSVLAEYGKEKNLLLSNQQANSLSKEELEKRNNLVTVFLKNLDYDFLKETLLVAVKQTQILNTITTTINEETLVNQFETSLRNIMVMHLTTHELEVLAEFVATETIVKLKDPKIFAHVYDAIITSFQTNGYDKEIAKFLTEAKSFATNSDAQA